MIDTLDSKRFDACTRSGRRSPPSKGSEGSRGETTPRTRADSRAARVIHPRLSHAGQPSTRRGGTTRDTVPGRTRAVGRGAPWEEALEAA